MNNKNLAIHLIGEQIRNQVLIIALEKLGLDCTIYTLNISEVILTLLVFDDKTDALYKQYFEMIEMAVEETSYINMDEMMRKWSNIIYSKLIEIKSNEIFLDQHGGNVAVIHGYVC